MTADELAKQRGVTVDRLRLQLKESFPDRKFDRHSELREDEISVLESTGVRKRGRKAKPNIINGFLPEMKNIPPPPPRRGIGEFGSLPVVGQSTNQVQIQAPPQRVTRKRRKPISLLSVKRSIFDVLVAGIVIGHAGLIWYDCWQLWSIPGIIGGGMAFMIVLAAVLVSTDQARYETGDTAIWTVLIIDIAAWFVHFPIFSRFSSIGPVHTGFICGFICLFSFLSLIIFRSAKNEAT